MVLGQGFISTVGQTTPNFPVKIPTKNGSFTTLKELITKDVPEFQDNARSVLHPLLLNGHLQTAYASLADFSKVDQILYGRQIIHYSDQGSGSLDYVISSDAFYKLPESCDLPLRTRFLESVEPSTDCRPLIIALHGLSGGSYESYVRCFLNEITTRHNFEAVVLNARGCSHSVLTSPQLFSGLWTEDIRHAVQHLRDLFPNRPFYGVGFSLGASILSNYIGQESGDCEFQACAVLGNPWDLAESSYTIHRSLVGRHIYSPTMAQSLVKLLETHSESLEKNPVFIENYRPNMKLASLAQFDNLFTAPMFGFNTAYEYYRHGSSVNRLLAVRTPLLIINAADDPIVGSDSIPYEEVECNPYCMLLTTTYGGHLGWFDLKFQRWYTKPLATFFASFHNQVDSAGDCIAEHLPRKNRFFKDRVVAPFF